MYIHIYTRAVVGIVVAATVVAFFISPLFVRAQNAESLMLNKNNTQYVTLPNETGHMVPASGNITVEAWIKLNSNGPEGIDQPILAKIGSSNISYKFVAQRLTLNGSPLQNQIQFFLSQDGSFQNAVYTTSEYDPEHGGLPLHQWIHVAATYQAGEGNRPVIYINGVEAPVGDSAGSITGIGTNSPPFTIGGEPFVDGATPYFDGNIDDVRIWDGVRSQSDIQANMNKELSGSESGLKGYWQFNGTWDSTDASGADFALQARNGADFSHDIPFEGSSVGPQGPQGPKGDTGDTGPQGPDGVVSIYNTSGTLLTTQHMVTGSGTATSKTLAVTFAGAAAFTSSTSYTCTANSLSGDDGVQVTYTSGTQVSFKLKGNTDKVRYVCVGN